MRRNSWVAASVLALTVASAANAQPPREREYDRGRTVYRDRPTTYDDGRYDQNGRRIRVEIRERGRFEGRDRWRPLAEYYAAATGRQFINILGRGGRYDKLLLEGVRGAPVITRVAVEYTNRQMQTFDLGIRLRRGADEVIDLPGRRRIHRIIVYTDPAYRGAYSIYGA